MNIKEELRKCLDTGFTKRDLETLIGLPLNNLSGYLGGSREFSKKNQLKIERWLKSTDKPDPLIFKGKKDSLEVEFTGEVIHHPDVDFKTIETGFHKLERNIGGEGGRIDLAKLKEIANQVPPMPEKLPGEDSLTFAARKNEWKAKYRS